MVKIRKSQKLFNNLDSEGFARGTIFRVEEDVKLKKDCDDFEQYQYFKIWIEVESEKGSFKAFVTTNTTISLQKFTYSDGKERYSRLVELLLALNLVKVEEIEDSQKELDLDTEQLLGMKIKFKASNVIDIFTIRNV